MSIEVDQQLDTSGLLCPEPLMVVRGKIRQMQAGQVLEVLATDPSTTRDIPKFCTFIGHELLDQQADNSEYRYWIRKKS